MFNFYPRPPGGGRPVPGGNVPPIISISIHALRVEGDVDTRLQLRERGMISIHALRVEGDISGGSWSNLSGGISIHALRVEGDLGGRW